MKQTLEETAHSFAESRSSGSLFPAYYQGFIAGAEWVLKEMSDHIRNNMSYSNKAWDILPFVEMIKGNPEPYIDYLRNKKAEAIQDIDMNVMQQNVSDIK